MKQIEDGLLKIADQYETSLANEGFDDYFDNEELIKVFSTIMSDYKKIIKTCSKEGLDVGDTYLNEYKEEFQSTDDICEKEEIIEDIASRIKMLIDICDDIPEEIALKYNKDLVEIMSL